MAFRRTMNCGRARNTGGYSDFRERSWYRDGPSAHRHSPVGEDRPFADGTFGCGDGMSRGRGNNSQGSGSKHSKHNPTSGYVCRERKPLPDDEDEFGKVQQAQDPLEAWASSPKQPECLVALDKVHKSDFTSLSTQLVSKEIYKDDVRIVQIGQIGQTQAEGAEDGAIILHVDLTLKLDIPSLNNECELPSESGIEDQPYQGKGPEKIEGNPSLFERNREKQNEIKRFIEEQNGILLRPGMILPRINDQVLL